MNEFLNDGVFWGLIGIALAIVGLGIPYLITYTRRKSELDEIVDFLKKFAVSQVDEKIAGLNSHENVVKNWGVTHGNQVEREGKKLLNEAKSEIRSLIKLKSIMTTDQKESLHLIIDSLVRELKNYAQNSIADEIESVSKELFI